MGLLDSIVRGAERLCEAELCSLARRRKVSALFLRYKIYNRVKHPMNGYLIHFVAARYARRSAALGELALVIPRCRTDHFSRSLLLAAVRLWKWLPSGVLSSGTLSSFKSAMDLCILRAWHDFLYLYFNLFLLYYSLLVIIVLRPFWFIGVLLFLVLCAR